MMFAGKLETLKDSLTLSDYRSFYARKNKAVLENELVKGKTTQNPCSVLCQIIYQQLQFSYM